MNINPFLLTDGYKTGHPFMYPENTKLVYSNFTARSGKHANFEINGVVAFGFQMTMIEINNIFKENFFSKNKEEVCSEVKLHYSKYLGSDFDISHIEALHTLGYLPVIVKALPEGLA